MVSKPLNTVLSVILLGLSVALLSGAIQFQNVLKNQIHNNIKNIDMVVGAKGSPLQLVLSAVLHIDAPVGNISLAEADKIVRHPMVGSAIPLSYGDNHAGYRIIGTTSDFLEIYNADFEKGSPFNNPFEVVVGFNVAKNLGLQLNNTFQSAHGLMNDGMGDLHGDRFKVVGILKPGNTVLDNLIVTSQESVWLVHEHEEEEANEVPDLETHHDEREITALLLRLKNPFALVQLPRQINENTNLQAVLPKYELDRLYQFTGIGFSTISLIAILIFIVSGLSIFISLFRMVKERRYELALMRTYGASQFNLIVVILIEAVLLGICGYLLGIMMAKFTLIALFGGFASDFKYHIGLPWYAVEDIFIFLFVVILIVLATLVAVLPIFKMNVSKILSDEN